MRAALALAALTAMGSASFSGCNNDEPDTQGLYCDAGDQAFVRRAILALDGRRPWGQAEVNAYEDAIKGIVGEGEAQLDARKLVAQAIMAEPQFSARWADFLMDSLLVWRTFFPRDLPGGYEPLQGANCFQPRPWDTGDLAAWVRDNAPSATNPPTPFTIGQLVHSALQLDDISPVFRAQLFNMLVFPLPGANVDPLDLERARRNDFGTIFETAYLHRDPTCLPCHNSETSATYDPDPAKNRAWPVPGLFEKAIYGASVGTDPIRSRSVFRFVDVADSAGQVPWGWSGDLCGSFKVPNAADPLGVDTYFASVRSSSDDPMGGEHASVWNLEASLHRGFVTLAKNGLQEAPTGEVDPDVAFAYLVSQNVVEKVWKEIIGSGLTIGNYFPRNQTERDVLIGLTNHFVASHYSLKTLLLDIVTHQAFNLKTPDAHCGQSAYELAPYFDPWTISDSDAAKRPNSPADGINPIPSRVLQNSLHLAMGWPAPSPFPGEDEAALQSSFGIFLRPAEPGFRGFDFQALLSWESSYAACQKRGSGDFISQLVAAAQQSKGSSIGDGVVAVKDRLVGEPWVDANERAAIEQLVGAPLDSTDQTNLDAKLRLVCGAYVVSPEFMLAGFAPIDTRSIPKLTPADHTYAASCADVGTRFSAASVHFSIACDSGTMSVSRN